MYWLVHVTIFGLIILSLYQALYFGVFGLGVVFSKHYPLAASAEGRSAYGGKRYLFIAALWVLLEYLRSNIGGGIGWNLLAYSQYQNIPIIQIADITGSYGVSFLIVLVNFTIFSVIKMAIRCQKTHKRLFAKSNIPFKEEIKVNPLFQTFGVMMLVVVVLLYGYQRIEALHKESAVSNKIKASVIQGNIKQAQKWNSLYKDFILDRYKKLTIEAAKEDPDLIIWPETSLPGYPNRDKALLRYVKNLARKVETPMLIGAPTVAMIDKKDGGDYNSALLFSKIGDLTKQYNKLHLVTFGEFVPFEKYLPWIRSLLPITGNFISGNEYTVFTLRPITRIQHRGSSIQDLTPKFSVLICFEDIFPDLSREFVKRGADFMINMTNDAWFGKTQAAYQHAANSVFRAIENRRPFIRATNTGLSCFIDRSGRVSSLSSLRGSVSDRSNPKELFVTGHKRSSIAIVKNVLLTFYTRFGDIFVLLCLFGICIFLIDYMKLRRYNT